MRTSKVLGILGIFLTLSALPVFAADYMEQCTIVDADGNGMIKTNMADSGPNPENDPSAWIWVPIGQCAKLNAGDYTGVSPDILQKIRQ